MYDISDATEGTGFPVFLSILFIKAKKNKLFVSANMVKKNRVGR